MASPTLARSTPIESQPSTSSSPATDSTSLAETMIEDEVRARLGVHAPDSASVDKSDTGGELSSDGPAALARGDEGMIWVEWDGPDDVQNPLNWPRSRKWLVSGLGITYTSIVSIAVTSYSIAETSVSRELGVSHEMAILGVTLFTITFGSAPLILAPLSEVIGRRWMYIITGCLFCLFYVPQALAPNIGVLLFFRLCLGAAGSTAISLVGGTLADVWRKEERGLWMSLFSSGAFAFTGVGACFSWLEATHGFRLISWCMCAITGLQFIALVFLSKETRASVLLARKAAKLRKETGDDRYQSHEFYHRPKFATMLKTNLTRPVRVLCSEIYVVAFTVWISFAWGVLYLLLGSLVIVFQGIYKFETGPLGMVYMTQAVGALLGFLIDHYYCEKKFRQNVAQRGPEARLYTAMCGGIVWPLGILIYTFTSYASVHWIAPAIGVSILYAGLFLIYLACFNTLADAYTIYASSVLAAMSFTRNMVGAVFPLFTNSMYAKLGVQGAGGLTFGLATVLSLTPFVLFRYGAGLRARSPFAQQLAKAEKEAEVELEKQQSRISS